VLPEVPAASRAVAVPAVHWVGELSIFNLLPAAVRSDKPLSFEELNQAYGYVLYRTSVDGGSGGGASGTDGVGSGGFGVLRIDGLRDFGIVFVNGSRVGVLDRRLKQDSLVLTLPAGRVRLDILVENLGRINFGPYLLKNRKGVVGDVVWQERALKGWEQYSLPFRHPADGRFREADDPASVPMLRKGVFRMESVADTYLDMREWGKGCVWVNGHNLGRYWRVGPQQTIYVPAEWLKKGQNEVVVFEELKPEVRVLEGIDHPILNEVR
jgi:beta-galactosidase